VKNKLLAIYLEAREKIVKEMSTTTNPDILLELSRETSRLDAKIEELSR
jgi:hypothetical protein